MSFKDPQIKLTNLAHAKRPWKSVHAEDKESIGKYRSCKPISQEEIDACLNCPYPNCWKDEKMCMAYRAKYIAEAEKK
jgi:hypothetical protein